MDAPIHNNTTFYIASTTTQGSLGTQFTKLFKRLVNLYPENIRQIKLRQIYERFSSRMHHITSENFKYALHHFGISTDFQESTNNNNNTYYSNLQSRSSSHRSNHYHSTYQSSQRQNSTSQQHSSTNNQIIPTIVIQIMIIIIAILIYDYQNIFNLKSTVLQKFHQSSLLQHLTKTALLKLAKTL